MKNIINCTALICFVYLSACSMKVSIQDTKKEGSSKISMNEKVTGLPEVMNEAKLVTIEFDRDIQVLELNRITVTNGSISNLNGGPRVFTLMITPLVDGPVVIESSFYFTKKYQTIYDNTPPSLVSLTASFINGLSSPGNDSTPTIRISNLENGETFNLYSEVTCASPIGTGVASAGGAVDIITSNLSDGIYSFYGKARDPAGNSTACEIIPLAYLIDTVAPSAPSNLNDGVWSASLSASPVITWVAGADASSGINEYEAQVVQRQGDVIISGWLVLGSGGSIGNLDLQDGLEYYFRIRSKDNAGNYSSVVESDGWIIDASAPTAISNLKDMNFGSNVESPLIQWAKSTDVNVGLASYQVAIGLTPGGSEVLGWQSVIDPPSPFVQMKLTGLNLSNGTIYYPSVKAVDNLGNQTAVASSDGFRSVEKWKNQNPSLTNYIGDSVWANVFQSDGKRVMLGSFTTAGGIPGSGAIRVNDNGTGDPTYKVQLPEYSRVVASIVQPDGKLLVGGDLAPLGGVVRLNADGSLDSTFTSVLAEGSSVLGLCLQSDGKVLVVGMLYNLSMVNLKGIVRLNANGSLDASFDQGGDRFDGPTMTIALQVDGKILVGGGFTTYDGVSQNRITRLNTDGSRDTSFNSGTGFNGNVLTIAIQTNGKVLIGGDFTQYNGLDRSRLIRLTSTGSNDPNFVIGAGLNSSVRTIKVQGDGYVVFGGDFTSYDGTLLNYIARIDSFGIRDNQFSLASFDASIYSIALQADGKILVGGSFSTLGAVSQNKISRLNTDGTRDTTFLVGNGFSGQGARIDSISLFSNGKIFAGGDGINSYQGDLYPSIVRIKLDGTIDTSFSVGSGFSSLNNYTLAIQTDGKLVVGGESTSYNGATINRIVRLNSNGSIDSNFTTGTAFDSGVYALALQSDGKILAAGAFTTYNGISRNRLARLNSDGSVDTGFTVGSGTPVGQRVQAFGLQADNKIVIGGDFTSYSGNSLNRITRISSAGVHDPTFNIGTGFDGSVTTIAVQDDGKVIVGGHFTTYAGGSANKIIRLTSLGSQDNTFVIGTGFEGNVSDIKIQSDGKILVAGEMTHYQGAPVYRLVRLNENGSLDTSFLIGGGFSAASVNCISISSEGKILLGTSSLFFDGNLSGTSVLLGW